MRYGHGRWMWVSAWTRTAVWMLIMAAAVAVAGCSSWGTPKMSLIGVDPNGDGFVETDSGQPFVPFGTNYYDPNTGWPPKIWEQFDPERVTVHFETMQHIGANCARVFLAAGSFQPDVNTVDRRALSKLDQLVRIARNTNVRLILTGPDHWEGAPAYWQPDRYAGEDALKAVENFWRVVGRRYRGERAILAWDLVNEPRMPWFVETWRPKWNAWIEAKYTDREGLKAAWGQELGENEQLGAVEVPEDVAEAGNSRLLDWQLFREHLADEWVRRQVEVLREADPTHMITIGYIQLSYPVVRPGKPDVYAAFNPWRQKKYLDFVSIHFYPLMGQPYESRSAWEQNLAYLQAMLAYCRTGIPVVLGEYGWYGGGAPEGRAYLGEDQQAHWLVAEIEASRRLARGWLSWPFADTPDANDMSVYGGLVNSNLYYKIWTRYFEAYASALSILPQPAPPLPSLDYVSCLTAPLNDLPPMFAEQAEKVQAAIRRAGPLPPMPEPKISLIKPLEE
jgi:hypothetical protein